MASPISPAPDDSMSEGGESPPATELCVPIDSLNVDGTAPAEGDSVDVKVGGTVSRVEGNEAYVKVETVNGEPVPDKSGETNEPSMSDLESMSAAHDAQG